MGHIGQRRNEKRADKKVKIIVSVFLVIMAISLIVALFTIKSDENDDDSPLQYEHAVSDEVEYYGLKIQVYSGHFESSFCGIEESSQTGETLFIVDVKMTNTTSKTISFESGLIFPSPVYTYKLIFDSDYSYNGTYKQYTNFLEAYSDINPLQTIDASLCFKVPNVLKTDTEKELKLEFKKNKVDDVDEIHYWIFREGVEE